jgi:hypothetical protein
MQTKFKFIIFIGLVIIIVAGFGIYTGMKTEKPGKFDTFAQCIRDSGAEFYGAFWCPHCQDQKKEFGTSAQYLPYVECSNPDNSQTQVCIDKKIESYPTWRFKDGTEQTGKLSFEVLAEKTSCPLPPAN